MTYTEKDIIGKFTGALNDPAAFYTKPFVNYRGKAENGAKYSGIIARELLKTPNFAALNSIPAITRKESYKTLSHETLANGVKPANSKRTEEWLGKKMYNNTYNYIGKVIDFQVPLKDTADNSAGKIDLLSYDDAQNTVWLLELKKPGSKETLLRCLLEAYTYWRTVDQEKLLRDFGFARAVLRPGVLAPKDSLAYQEAESLTPVFKDEGNGYEVFEDEAYKDVYALMAKLRVDVFVLEAYDGNGTVQVSNQLRARPGAGIRINSF